MRLFFSLKRLDWCLEAHSGAGVFLNAPTERAFKNGPFSQLLYHMMNAVPCNNNYNKFQVSACCLEGKKSRNQYKKTAICS